MSTRDPVRRLQHAAARGGFPAENGHTDVVGAVPGAPAAVLSFTAHHVVAADVPPAEVRARIDPADLKGPLAPGVLAWPAERTGPAAGSLDVVLAWLPERSPAATAAVHEVEPGDHPRVARARRWRRDVRVFEAAGGMVVLGPSAPRCSTAGRPTSCAARSAGESQLRPGGGRLGSLRPRLASVGFVSPGLTKSTIVELFPVEGRNSTLARRTSGDAGAPASLPSRS